MEEIKDKSGKVIKRSRNLRGFMEFIRNNMVETLTITQSLSGDGTGTLSVVFRFGDTYETTFASFGVLAEFVRGRKNLQGATIYGGGVQRGYVNRSNEYLLHHGYRG